MTTNAAGPGVIPPTRTALAAVLLAFALGGCGGSAIGSPAASGATAPSPSASPTATPVSGPTAAPSGSAALAYPFIPTGSMAIGRFGQSAVLLPDGRVLIAGGEVDGGESNSAELYDAATGRFSQTGPMGYYHTSPAAVLLQSGRVLVTGGPL